MPQSARSIRALARDVAALRADIQRYRTELHDVVDQFLGTQWTLAADTRPMLTNGDRRSAPGEGDTSVCPQQPQPPRVSPHSGTVTDSGGAAISEFA